jgi:hypothetical protein
MIPTNIDSGATVSTLGALSTSGLTGLTSTNTGLIYNPTATPLNAGIPYCIDSSTSYINFTLSTTNLMENNTSQPQQVQVAVFEIERNEDQQVVSTKLVKEFWLEHKPKANLTLAVAKELAKDVDLDKIVIRELSRISF